jgi:hypothetical protein
MELIINDFKFHNILILIPCMIQNIINYKLAYLASYEKNKQKKQQ